MTVEFVNFHIHPATRERVRELKHKGQTYSGFLEEVLDLYQNINTIQKFSLRDLK